MPLLRTTPELLVGFRNGDPAAFERVYRHHVRGLDGYFRALARFAGTPELAQPSALSDLLQEAFIRAFSESARMAYDGLRDFTPYLNTIARNCFIDAIRRRRKEVLVGLNELPTEGVEPPAFDDSYDPRVVAVLELYLKELPSELRGVYEQRFVRGASQEGACGALGISRRSLRTAETHLRRGLRRALLMAGLLSEAAPRSMNALEVSRF